MPKDQDKLESKLYSIFSSDDTNADLTECGLKSPSSTIYNYCRVFRKETLDLSRNNLKCLSSNATQRSDLEKLNGALYHFVCSSNQLKSISDGIFAILSLRTLVLSYNQINRLSPEIGRLQNLEQLDLRSNVISSIPETIGNLKKLKFLEISFNPLDTLPYQLGDMATLQHLRMDGLSMKFPPQNVCSAGICSIRMYLNSSVPFMVDGNEDVQLLNPDGSSADSVSSSPHVEALPVLPSGLETLNEQLEEDEKLWRISDESRTKELLQVRNDIDKDQEDFEHIMEKYYAEQAKMNRAAVACTNKIDQYTNITINRLLDVRKDVPPVQIVKEQFTNENLTSLFTALSTSLNDPRGSLNAVEDEINELIAERCINRQIEEANNVNTINKLKAEFELLYEKRQARRSASDLQLIYNQIHHDQQLLEELFMSMNNQTNENYQNIQAEVLVIENALHNLTFSIIKRKSEENGEVLQNYLQDFKIMSEIYEELLMEKERQRSQLHSVMHSMLEEEELVQNLVAAEALRRYAELISSTSIRFPSSSSSKHSQSKHSETKAVAVESHASESKTVSYLRSRKKISDLLKERGFTSVFAMEECILCFDNKGRVLFVPCGHACVCPNCSIHLLMCPICRAPISQKFLLPVVNGSEQ